MYLAYGKVEAAVFSGYSGTVASYSLVVGGVSVDDSDYSGD